MCFPPRQARKRGARISFSAKAGCKNINCSAPANLRYLQEFVWFFSSESAFSGSLDLEEREGEGDTWG